MEKRFSCAARQRSINGIALETAARHNVDLDTAQLLGTTGARLGVPIEFVSEAELAPRPTGQISPLGKGTASLQSTAGGSLPPTSAASADATPLVRGGQAGTVPSGQYAHVTAPAKADVAQYSEKEYTGFGWARVNGVLTAAENAQLRSAFADNRKLKFQYVVNEAGETIIPVGKSGNKLVYCTGTFENLQITRVVEINYIDDVSVEQIRSDILECEREGNTESYQFIKNYYGEELFLEYSLDDYENYRELVDRGGEGAGGGNGAANRGERIDGRRSLTENPSDVGEISEELRDTGKDGNTFFGGMYDSENGRILLNADAINDGRITVGQSLDFVLKHELTHKIERAGAWDNLAALAREAMGAEAFDAKVQELQQRRAAAGDTAGSTPEGAKKEVVADWIGTNLFKKEFATLIARKYKGFANNLVLTLTSVRRGLAATEKGRQAARMRYAEQLYLKALAETAPDVTDEQIAARLEELLDQMAEDGEPTAEGGESLPPSSAASAATSPQANVDHSPLVRGGQVETVPSGQYAVAYTTDNRPVVVVEEDILDGIPKSEWTKTVRDTMSKKFPNGIPISGRLIKVNKISRSEFTGSKSTQYLEANDGQIYVDKLKSANNLDEIILASTNYINEDLKHNRKDSIKQFARGDVLIRVGNNDYSAKVIIAFTGSNQMLLYDIVEFSPVSVNIKKRTSPAAMQNAGSHRTAMSSSNTNVPQNVDGVNSQSMQNGGENSPIAGQRSQMTPEIAAQLRKNQAEIDERNRRRGIQKADAQAEIDAVVDNDVDSDVDTDVDLDAEDIVDLSSDNELAERIGAQRGAGKYKIIQEYILEQLGGQEIVFSDGRKVIVDRSDALHLANRAANKKTAQISKIKELIEIAQLYAEDSDVEHTKFDYFCYYQAMVQYNGDVFPLYLNVGRAKNGGEYHLYDITNKLRDTADRINGLERPKPNEGYALTNGVSMDSISENGENVNGKFDLSTPERLQAQAAALEKQAAKKEKDFRRKPKVLVLSSERGNYTARVTFPERRQRVQAYTLFGEPSTTAFTRQMLGFQVRLDRLWEWETRIPKVTLLPQKSHFAMVLHLLFLQAGWAVSIVVFHAKASLCAKQRNYISRYRRKNQVFFTSFIKKVFMHTFLGGNTCNFCMNLVYCLGIYTAFVCAKGDNGIMLRQFMENRGSMDFMDAVYLLLGYAVLILLVLPVHEWAHAYVAHRCGDDTAKWNGRLTLNPFRHLDAWGTVMMLTVGIGYAKPVPVQSRNFRHYKRDMILVALAGPLSNFLMAVVAVGIYRVSLLLPLSYAVYEALTVILVQTVAGINVALMVFNLLPIPPLDGSRLWSSLLPPKWSYMMERYSQYITIGLILLIFSGALDVPLALLRVGVFRVIFAIFGLN